MSRVWPWLACGAAAVVVAGAGAVVAQGLVVRGIGAPVPWRGEAAAPLWLVGLALVAASGVAAWTRRSGSAMLLAVIAATWVAPVFGAWLGGPPPVVAAAAAASALLLPALWQLLLDSSARPSRARTSAIVAMWIAVGAACLVLLLLRDAFSDPRCVGACTPNPLLVVPLPGLVAAAHVTVGVAGAAVCAATLSWALRCLARRRPVSSLAAAPATIIAGAATAWTAFAPIDAALAFPTWPAVLAASLALLAAAHLALGVAALRRSALLRALSADLAAGEGGDLRARLAAALGDRRLEVRYPLGAGRWVDAEGIDREPPDGTAATELRREGETIAVVVGGGDAVSDLERIGAAASLAIDNERLRAGISAHLADLRASRLGVVEAGDQERRRIERNLHDGMQQSLLVLQYELGIAASHTDDPPRRDRLSAMREEAHAITERLREIAHGVFPAALDDLGVTVALQRLADDAPVPIELSGAPDPRPPRPIERTVYLIADETLAAGSAAPGSVCIALKTEGDGVSVRTTNSSSRLSSVLRDRIEALGGRIAEREAGLEVLLPCASS